VSSTAETDGLSEFQRAFQRRASRKTDLRPRTNTDATEKSTGPVTPESNRSRSVSAVRCLTEYLCARLCLFSFERMSATTHLPCVHILLQTSLWRVCYCS
jgi:hypothetical protein